MGIPTFREISDINDMTKEGYFSKIIILKMATHKLSLSSLQTFLEGACESLRGNMDASEYKEYIIVRSSSNE